MAFVVLAGCGKGSGGGKDDQAEKLDAADAKWKDTELTIGSANAKFFMTGSGEGDPLFMDGYFDKFPAGTEVDVAGTKGTTDERGHLSLNIDMKNKVGALALRDLTSKAVDLDAKVIIKAPGSDTIEQKLPAMRVETAVGAALARVRDGALKFDGEPNDDGKVSSAALVDTSSMSKLTLVGNAEKVWDIDWVAVETQKESDRTKACSGYEKVKGEVQVVQIDSVVKIYERRTGKMLHEQTFQPKEECPSFVSVSSDNKAKAFVLPMQVEPWVRENLDKMK